MNLSLFSPPLPIFRRLTNLRHLHRLASSPPPSVASSHRRVSFPIARFHTHLVRVSASDSPPPHHHHQLPEWAELIKSLSKAGYFIDSAPSPGFENEFFPGLPEEILRQCIACLALARDRPELLEFISEED